ncbi:MAG: aldehyde dehydrogenase [Spirochaetes bacterium]|jgi:aldehyde dehydrogenase (NAD+)|nr:aldehyde dehydrogenase [Spirochaetota bacterium]
MKNIDTALEKLRTFYESGETISLQFRLNALKSLKKVIKENESAIIRSLSRDFHKPSSETYTTEIGFILDEIRNVEANLKKWGKPRKVSTPLHQFPASSSIIKEPYGTVLIMAPWNYPFQLALSPLVGAIAAGNTVLLKPSEISSHTSKLIAKLVAKAFVPGHVNVILGAVKTNSYILKQRFDYIFFTGSTVVGRIVMQAAANNLTPVTLELGGKSPAIVHKDANIKLAAKRIAWGKFINMGQTCVAPDYLFVHSSVKEIFITEFEKFIHQFYGKDASKSAHYARVINSSHYARLKNYLKQGTVLIGGDSNDRKLYIQPTVLEDVSENSDIMKDEIFGPILPVITYDDLDISLEFIRKRPKPLALYIFSESKAVQKRVLSQTNAGGVTVNDTIVHLANPALPFGGVGSSGIGAYHGRYSFDTFSATKSVMFRSSRIDLPFRYPPYGRIKDKIIRLLLR